MGILSFLARMHSLQFYFALWTLASKLARNKMEEEKEGEEEKVPPICFIAVVKWKSETQVLQQDWKLCISVKKQCWGQVNATWICKVKQGPANNSLIDAVFFQYH